MTTSSEKAKELISLYNRTRPFEEILKSLSEDSKIEIPVIPDVPGKNSWSAEAAAKRQDFLESRTHKSLASLSGKSPMPDPETYKGNIESFIGMTQVPTGIVGPVYIRGTAAYGDFYVPMATTEGALIASYNRGAKACRLSGGITSVCLTETVQRAPLFRFHRLAEVGAFMYWILDKLDIFKSITLGKSRFAKLIDLRLNMEGNQVVIIFEYTTGDAAGQNMVTICTEAICTYIIEHTPIQPTHWFIESNYSGDKKATAVSFSSVRGKKVTAEAVIKKQYVKEVLSSDVPGIVQYWQSSSVAAVQSGSIGIQGHFANGLTAIFLACGQDVACVAEAYVGITRMEKNEDGDLYVAVTLPSLMVGTVGGGTGLTTQHECLDLLECTGPGTARKFAEICGATVLAGELSIAAALASGQFSKAHRIFGRK
ncbi:MAG: hydroxymethylglutaryl-CoA reductase [Bacteroidia bacterium]|nr:hydroxymethylglutaryl-CoA reductase [Bacteroidia bacterium]